MKIDIKDLYWAAGFIDGEGYMSSRGGDTTPTVSANQNARELLDRLSNLFGGNVKQANPIYKGKPKPIYVWRIYGARAVGVMMTIYSLMSEKRKKEIREALAIWRAKPTLKGENHYSSNVSDKRALAILRRVMLGEYICDVARNVKVSEKSIESWLSGKRGYLLEQLKSEGLEYKGQLKRLSGEGHHQTKITDEQALEVIRRVVLNDESQTRVSRNTGISQAVIYTWVSGKSRPYLLAKVREEQQALKASSLTQKE